MYDIHVKLKGKDKWARHFEISDNGKRFIIFHF